MCVYLCNVFKKCFLNVPQGNRSMIKQNSNNLKNLHKQFAQDPCCHKPYGIKMGNMLREFTSVLNVCTIVVSVVIS